MNIIRTSKIVVSRLVAGCALALALVVGIAGTPTPAAAAGAGNVTFCLSYTGGRGAYASKPVYLYAAAPGATSWGQPYKTGATNAQGCATWRGVPTGYHYATQGYWTYTIGWNAYYFNGWTGSAYLGTNSSTVTQPSGLVAGAYLLY